jgi:hypothetical protein
MRLVCEAIAIGIRPPATLVASLHIFPESEYVQTVPARQCLKVFASS